MSIIPAAIIIDRRQPRRFPLLTKEGSREVAADTLNARRVDRNKHCFMKHRGSETQRRIERKKKKQKENFA